MNSWRSIMSVRTTTTQQHYVLEVGDNWINYPDDCVEILEIWDRDNHTLLEHAKDGKDIPPLCGKHNPHDLAKPLCYYVTQYCKDKSIHFYPYPKACTLFTMHYVVDK